MTRMKRKIELTEDQIETVLYLLTNNRGWYTDADKELYRQTLDAMLMCNTNPMVLIYQNSEGQRFSQNWEDLTEMGTLVDPETGDDLEMIGWHSPQNTETVILDEEGGQQPAVMDETDDSLTAAYMSGLHDGTWMAHQQPAVAAIQFSLEAEEGLQFLRLWNVGEFDACRREWPEAPASVYVGADPSLAQQPGAVDEAVTGGCVVLPRYFLDFLLGQGALEGFWFGDKPATEKTQFWWRSRLRALAAQPGGSDNDR